MSITRRKRIAFTAAGLLAASAVLAALVRFEGERRLAAAMERFERDVGALDPAAHAPPALPDGENAAHWLREGAAALALSAADRKALDDFWRDDDTVPGPGVADLIGRHGEALAHLRRAGGLTRSSWGVAYAEGPGTMPDLLGQLVTMKVLLADARLAIDAGDRGRLLADATALAAMRRALRREPAFLFQLVATAVEPAHHRLIQGLLASGLVDAALLEEVAGQLDPPETAGDSLRAAIAVEASWLVASLDDFPDGEEPTPWARLRHGVERLWAPREAVAGLALFHRLALASELPATRIAEVVRSREPTAPAMDVVAEILIPNLIDGVEKHRAAAAARRLAGLAIDLRLHALRHGAYPESLADFTAAAVPDPYAEGALRWEVHPDAAELSFPVAESLWRERYPYGSRHGPRFVWTLPAT